MPPPPPFKRSVVAAAGAFGETVETPKLGTNSGTFGLRLAAERDDSPPLSFLVTATLSDETALADKEAVGDEAWVLSVAGGGANRQERGFSFGRNLNN